MSLDINNPFPFEGLNLESTRTTRKKAPAPKQVRTFKPGMITRLAATEENNLIENTEKVAIKYPESSVGWGKLAVLAGAITAASIGLANNRESNNEIPKQPAHVVEVEHPADVGVPIVVHTTPVAHP